MSSMTYQTLAQNLEIPVCGRFTLHFLYDPKMECKFCMIKFNKYTPIKIFVEDKFALYIDISNRTYLVLFFIHR